MLAYTKEQFGVLKENYIKNDKFSFFASFCRDNLIYRIDKVLKVCQIKTKDGSRLREKAQLVIDIANELENYLNSLQDLGVEIPDFSELTDQIDDLLRKQIQGYLGAKSTKDR